MHTISIFRKSVAEFIGTFMLVFFGCGSVHTATLFGAQVGLWQIAIIWGLVIAFAIFITGAVSGGHLNPAMTLAFAVHRKLPIREIIPYWMGQFSGAFCAAALLFVLFQPNLKAFEESRGIVRGQPASVITARCYGEYYSSPESVSVDSENPDSWQTAWQKQSQFVPIFLAFLAELFGTAMLALIVFALIDHRNPARPAAHLVPLFIGLTISMLISIIAPLTQAGFNPARDFAPRLFAFIAGWGETAIPGPNGHGFWIVYIVAPCCGSVIGGALYDLAIRPALPKEETT
ncbi:MAG: aquaporin family protein [Planctomycetaceae bacterium]|jgi:glycerol uptake facilitator protein|nr:aquaporin family protein [Planctomycetaceae bacterium]